METNEQKTLEMRAAGDDKKEGSEEQTNPLINDPVNTTVGVIDVIKQFFKSIT